MIRRQNLAARSCGAVGALLIVGSASVAAAEPQIAAHLEAGAARAVGESKSDQFGWGALGLGAVELQLHPSIGLEIAGGVLGLDGDDPFPPPGVAPTSSAVAGFVLGGPRLRPLAMLEPAGDGLFRADGLWLAGGVGAAATEPGARAALRAALGYDLTTSLVKVGPMVGFLQVIEPDGDSLRPEDARVLTFGVHAQLGGARRAAAPVDTDRDGIFDDRDRCVEVPEDRDGFEDEDGCPDLDDDADGIPDTKDGCRLEPEDRDGFQDEDGCPDLDDDADGVPDAKDLCRTEPEDRDGRNDDDGCPDLDDDLDGIPDAVDRCPEEPETKNGILDEDGCPDTADVAVIGDRIVLEERVHFPTGSAVIDPKSKPLLTRLAAFLQAHPEYKRLHVTGHADDIGPDAFNLALSRKRAQSVVTQLVFSGVDAARLAVDAHGESQPRAEGVTAEARSANRRVELTILERGSSPAPSPPPAPPAPAPSPAQTPAPTPAQTPAPTPAPAGGAQ